MIHGKVSSTPAPAFLAGGGEMGALMRAHDWSATLGPVEAWPQALRQALGICLNAQHPIGIYWGEQRRLLYNDAWRRLIGEKHPGALGAPAGEVFPEAWPSIEPTLTEVFATGVAAGSADDLSQHDPAAPPKTPCSTKLMVGPESRQIFDNSLAAWDVKTCQQP